MLSKSERNFLIDKSDRRRLTPQRAWSIRKNILKKIQRSINVVITLNDSENGRLLLWLWSSKDNNRVLWSKVRSVADSFRTPEFRRDYSIVYKSGRNDRGEIIYWREDLRGTNSRQYRNGVLSGEVWDPDFQYKGLKRSSEMLLRKANSLGLEWPPGRDEAVTRRGLKRKIKEREMTTKSDQ